MAGRGGVAPAGRRLSPPSRAWDTPRFGPAGNSSSGVEVRRASFGTMARATIRGPIVGDPSPDSTHLRPGGFTPPFGQEGK